jgi:hypothetical protein
LNNRKIPENLRCLHAADIVAILGETSTAMRDDKCQARSYHFVIAEWRAREAESRRVKNWQTALASLVSLFASLAVAEDFKTLNVLNSNKGLSAVSVAVECNVIETYEHKGDFKER